MIIMCPCGNELSTIRSPNPRGGRLVRDVDSGSVPADDSTCTLIERSRLVLECDQCGRLGIDMGSLALVWYSPDSRRYAALLTFR